MRFKKPIIALTAASALALAGCGGSGGGSAEQPEAPKNEDAGNTGTAQDPTREGPVEIEGAQEGGTVTVISAAGLNTMDPTEAYYQNTWSILSNLVTRSLTQLVYDEESGNMTLVPDLATDLGTPNDDYTEWKFTLREGIKYENGQEVKPEDYVFGLCRSLDRTAFPEGAAYSNDYFLGGDTYKGPYTDPNGKCEAASVDGNVLTIKMRKPFPDMPYWGTFPATGPIPEGADSAPEKYAQHPWATGPYMFGDYTPEKSLTLVRNPEWDPASDPGRTQYPESYEMDFQTESAKIDQILLADKGADQATMSYDDVLNEDYRTFSSEHADRLEIGTFPLTSYWAPDYRKITDIKIRQALAWAYPYEDALLAAGLIQDVNATFGNTLMPPGTPGRKDFNPLEGHELGQTDAEKARALLEEADAVGYTITWPFAKDDDQLVAQKDVIVEALKAAGFDPQPVASTVADLSTLRADPDADINVRTAGWIADWPSGGAWFPPVIQSTDLKAEGLGSNYSVFNEPAVDEQIAAIQEMPVEDQPAAWGDLDETVMTDYFPLFVTRYGGVAQMHGSAVNGHNIDNTIGMPTWRNIWVSQ